MGKEDHECLRGAVHGHALLRSKANHRGHIDDRTLPCLCEAWRHRTGEPGERHDVQSDQAGNFVTALFNEGARKGSAGIVHQDANIRVVTQPRFDLRDILSVTEVGLENLDVDARLGPQPSRKRLHSYCIARDHHDRVTATRKAICVHRTDPGRSSGNQDCWFMLHDIALS